MAFQSVTTKGFVWFAKSIARLSIPAKLPAIVFHNGFLGASESKRSHCHVVVYHFQITGQPRTTCTQNKNRFPIVFHYPSQFLTLGRLLEDFPNTVFNISVCSPSLHISPVHSLSAQRSHHPRSVRRPCRDARLSKRSRGGLFALCLASCVLLGLQRDCNTFGDV